ncbi:hypothetical protein ABT272_30910 [Streptomyces sp900105245]|uniref:Secreted protein n=1 Tax=Streptomyces sp. 900105245 TaxID=3154379 RepID=A0ABV1UEG2_9ACTN
MDSTIWGALIGAAASLAVFVSGAWVSSLKDKATDRAAAAKEARAAVQTLIKAAFDVKAAMTIWDVRRRDRRTPASAWLVSFAQVMDGFNEDRVYRGVAEGLGSAMTWRRAEDAAEETVVTGPLSHMTAAAAQIAMLDDAELRRASTEVTDALGQLVATYTERARSGARAEADNRLEAAIGRLGDAARAYTGRPTRGALSE